MCPNQTEPLPDTPNEQDVHPIYKPAINTRPASPTATTTLLVASMSFRGPLAVAWTVQVVPSSLLFQISPVEAEA